MILLVSLLGIHIDEWIIYEKYINEIVVDVSLYSLYMYYIYIETEPMYTSHVKHFTYYVKLFFLILLP